MTQHSAFILVTSDFCFQESKEAREEVWQLEMSQDSDNQPTSNINNTVLVSMEMCTNDCICIPKSQTFPSQTQEA